MAITCPRCGAQFDATLFQFGHRVRCRCGEDVEYPGADQRAGHVVVKRDGVVSAQDDAEGLGKTPRQRPSE